MCSCYAIPRQSHPPADSHTAGMSLVPRISAQNTLLDPQVQASQGSLLRPCSRGRGQAGPPEHHSPQWDCWSWPQGPLTLTSSGCPVCRYPEHCTRSTSFLPAADRGAGRLGEDLPTTGGQQDSKPAVGVTWPPCWGEVSSSTWLGWAQYRGSLRSGPGWGRAGPFHPETSQFTMHLLGTYCVPSGTNRTPS